MYTQKRRMIITPMIIWTTTQWMITNQNTQLMITNQNTQLMTTNQNTSQNTQKPTMITCTITLNTQLITNEGYYPIKTIE